MIENVSTQLTVFHCFAHCLLPGRAFASLYALLFLEKEAEIGGRVYPLILFGSGDKTELHFPNEFNENEKNNMFFVFSTRFEGIILFY